MVNIQTYAKKLYLLNGIYFSEKIDAISYPEDGHENCFEIEENSFWFKHRNNCIIEAIKKYCPNDVFFDVGGGNGFVASGLEKNGIPTILVEPGLDGCVNAKKRGLSNVVCSTLENAAFIPNTLPAVGLFDVVEHVENDLNFLITINKYLKEGGVVVITVPAYNLLWSNDDDHAGHFRRYTLKNLGRVLKKSNFRIEYASYIFSILPLPILLYRSLPSRLGFHKKSNGFEKQQNEHKKNRGIFNHMLDMLWSKELQLIGAGKKIPFGGSCLVIATKVTR